MSTGKRFSLGHSEPEWEKSGEVHSPLRPYPQRRSKAVLGGAVVGLIAIIALALALHIHAKLASQCYRGHSARLAQTYAEVAHGSGESLPFAHGFRARASHHEGIVHTCICAHV